MNILIKLMSIVSLVIAPYIAVNGGGADKTMMHGEKMECHANMAACGDMDMNHCDMKMGNCDLSKCKTMTKEECAAYCDEMKCTPEQKEKCLSMYGADGKFDEAKCKEMCAAEMKGKCMDGCTKGCEDDEACKKSCDDKCVESHKNSAKKGACCADGEKDKADCKH